MGINNTKIYKLKETFLFDSNIQVIEIIKKYGKNILI